MRPCFSDIMRLEFGREYEEIADFGKLRRALEEKSEEFSSTKIIFFDEAIFHTLRIARVLRQPRGSIMLIGVGGSGKQTLTRLASFILGAQNKNIEITKDFGPEAFREFIKGIKLLTGCEQQPVTFLFTDNQIVHQSFLEDINSLLNSGEVPNLWEPEEKKKIIDDVRELCLKKGRPDQPDVIYQTFVEEVRQNLHLVLCMSPVSDKLRVHCRQSPSLVDCCTLDWFASWPEDALASVSAQLLQDLPIEAAVKAPVIELTKAVHAQSLALAVNFDLQFKRKVYNTPKSFLDFIKLYQKAFFEKKEEQAAQLHRLSNGLTKLEQANTQVAQLKVALKELQP